jgi:hypothetical protein
MRNAGMKMNDFLFLTGRSIIAVGKFLNEEKGAPFTPTMGDVLILELAARDPKMLDRMTAIANEYSLGPAAAPDDRNQKRSA